MSSVRIPKSAMLVIGLVTIVGVIVFIPKKG